MPTSNTEELGRFLKCTVIGRGVFGPCACCDLRPFSFKEDITRDFQKLFCET